MARDQCCSLRDPLCCFLFHFFCFLFFCFSPSVGVVLVVCVFPFVCVCFSSFFAPTAAESFGVSAQIGSGVVRGGPEVRFHEGSTRVPRGFHQGSTRVLHEGSARFCEGCGVVRAPKRAPHAVGDIT